MAFIILLLSRQKWFRGRKIHTDWDIRVEQCQFSELAITANTEEGISVGIVSVKNGQRSVKYEEDCQETSSSNINPCLQPPEA